MEMVAGILDSEGLHFVKAVTVTNLNIRAESVAALGAAL